MKEAEKTSVLVTGDRGFIGRYLVSELLSHGHIVVGIDNNSKHGNVSLPYDNNERYFCYRDDARSKRKLSFLCDKYNIDVIISNAALIGGVKYFHEKPFQIIDQNTKLVHAVLNTVIEKNIEQVITISSSMVYERAHDFPVEEGQELSVESPISSYGFQKLESEYVCRAAHDECGVNYTIVRPFNAVGLGEEMKPDDPGFAHVIPDFIYKIKKAIESGSNEIKIFGNGDQVRCFTHARDIVRGISGCILNHDAYLKSFNFTTEEPIDMKSLAQKIWEKMKVRLDCYKENEKLNFKHVAAFPCDVKRRVGSFERAKNILGWKPKYNLNEILEEMIDEFT